MDKYIIVCPCNGILIQQNTKGRNIPKKTWMNLKTNKNIKLSKVKKYNLCYFIGTPGTGKTKLC